MEILPFHAVKWDCWECIYANGPLVTPIVPKLAKSTRSIQSRHLAGSSIYRWPLGCQPGAKRDGERSPSFAGKHRKCWRSSCSQALCLSLFIQMRLIISSIGMPDHLGNSRQRPFLLQEACVEATKPFQTGSHMRRYRTARKISAFRSRGNVTFRMILLLIFLQLVVLPLAKKGA